MFCAFLFISYGRFVSVQLRGWKRCRCRVLCVVQSAARRNIPIPIHYARSRLKIPKVCIKLELNIYKPVSCGLADPVYQVYCCASCRELLLLNISHFTMMYDSHLSLFNDNWSDLQWLLYMYVPGLSEYRAERSYRRTCNQTFIVTSC